MKLIVGIVFLTLSSAICYGQQCLDCKKSFDRLIEIEQQDQISDSELNESLEIVTELYKKGYTDYIDSVSNNTSYVSKNLTHTFCIITRKRCDTKGVNYYLNYLQVTTGSAEEERSFGLERLFKDCPETVLDKLDQSYFGDLAWGFVNNRLYGPDDPFEDDGFKAMTFYDSAPERKLTLDNYNDIFNETYPTLTSNENYSEDIKLILQKIAEILEHE